MTLRRAGLPRRGQGRGATRSGQPLPVEVLWGPGRRQPHRGREGGPGISGSAGRVLGSGGVERLPAGEIGARRAVQRDVAGPGSRATTSPRSGSRRARRGRPSCGRSTLPAGEDGKPHWRSWPRSPWPRASPRSSTSDPRTTRCSPRLGHDSRRSSPVGEWIGPIVVPLMGLLRWVHGRVGNYGWSIVVLTVLINLVMAPLRHYSIANGMKMAKTGPGDAGHPGALPQGPAHGPEAPGDAGGDRRRSTSATA